MIETFLDGMDASAFLASELHKAATLQKLAVIGAAAARLSHTFREAHSQAEWRDIIAFRNIAVHAYFAVQREQAGPRAPHREGCQQGAPCFDPEDHGEFFLPWGTPKGLCAHAPRAAARGASALGGEAHPDAAHPGLRPTTTA